MKKLLSATAVAAFLAGPLIAQDFTEQQIKDLALQAFLENPQIVRKPWPFYERRTMRLVLRLQLSLLQARDARGAGFARR